MKLIKGHEYTLAELNRVICGECGGDIAWYGVGLQELHNGPFSHQMGICVNCGEKYTYSNQQKVKIY